MAEGKAPLDWASGESLALASLATEGTRIRLTGQDSGPIPVTTHRHSSSLLNNSAWVSRRGPWPKTGSS